MTVEELTLEKLEELLANFDAHYETIASLFAQVTNTPLGRCSGCRREAELILRNYLNSRQPQQLTAKNAKSGRNKATESQSD